MRTTPSAAAALLITIAFVGCGGSDDTPPATTIDGAQDLGPDDVAADNYDIGYTVCGSFPIEDTAAEYDAASNDPADVATAYAEGYRDAYRQPAFEGCLDALLGKPKDPP